MRKGTWFQLKVMGTIAGGVLLLVFFLNFPDKSGDWASWVQAFGSIAAILVAAQVATLQLAQGRQEEAERRVAHLKGVRGLLDELNGTLSRTGMEVLASGGENVVRYARERLRPMSVALEAIRRIPFHEVPLVYMGSNGLNYLNMFSSTYQTLESLAAEEWDPEDEKQTTRVAKAVADIVRFCQHADADLKAIREMVDSYDGIKSPNVTVSDIE